MDIKDVLTKREFEVLKYLILGMTNNEIAKILVIEPCTVKAHVGSIIKKTGAKNRLDVAMIATATEFSNPHQDSKRP